MRKSSPPREIPPPLELECLKVLWRLGEGNVNGVREILLEHRNLAYTTVMTLLDRLVRRGAATRRKSGRSFVYSPLVSRDTLRNAALRELADSLFDGSVDALLAHCHGGNSLPPVQVAAPAADFPPSAPAADERLDTALL
jgi:predicted transcriptional regulator